MFLNVIDGQGNLQSIIVQGQQTPADKSGLLADNASAVLLDVNGGRSGWFFQNLGTDNMYVNDVGQPATALPTTANGSILVRPGESFPPCGYPITTLQINIIGGAGQPYVAREW